MSITLSIFASNDWGGDDCFEISSEMAHNGNAITLHHHRSVFDLTLYLPLEQWWALRSVFPKSPGYSWSIKTPGIHSVFERDHASADKLALEHYEKHRDIPVTPAARDGGRMQMEEGEDA